MLICFDTRIISIHALRKEGDSVCHCERRNGKAFLSTPSARRATCRTGHVQVITAISIHALRKEGDLLVLFQIPPI